MNSQTLEQPPALDAVETQTVPSQSIDLASNGRARALTSTPRFTIDGPRIIAATSTLPDDQREAIRWLHYYATEYDLPLAELAAKLRRPNGEPYSKNTLYQVLTGQHGADLANITKAIIDFRKIAEERAATHRAPFIETSITKQIWEVCDYARSSQEICLIYSDGQIGKTTALEEYKNRNNHGRTQMIRMPTGGALRHFLQACAVYVRVSPSRETSDLRLRISLSFDENMLLIIDEVSQIFAHKNRVRTDTIDYIREIYDTAKCGIVLCATNVTHDEIQQGKHKILFKQLDRRMAVQIPLPTTLPESDLNRFSAEYGLPPASKQDARIQRFQQAVIEKRGLGVWCKRLQSASRIAAKRAEKMQWKHVLLAELGRLRLIDPKVKIENIYTSSNLD
jgi:DNA transposition AAA+ family ATPase